MKHKLLSILAAALLLAGCAPQTSQAEYIGIGAAKAIALEAAGVSEAAADFSTAGLDRRGGTDYYAVDFTANGQTYEYDIDAVTGVIIDGAGDQTAQDGAGDAAGLETEGAAAAPAGNAAQDNTVQTTAPAGNTAQDNTVQTTAPSGNAAQDNTVQTTTPAGSAAQTGGGQTDGGTITEDKAREIALAHAGLTAGEVTFLKTKLDREDGRLVYDVEFYTADYSEYDYEIDAADGTILSYDFDAEGYTAPSAGSTAITADEAKEIALAEVPGATVDDIYEFELDRDDGRLEYEGSIWYDGTEYEFTIDGYSGAIREWEAERHDR